MQSVLLNGKEVSYRALIPVNAKIRFTWGQRIAILFGKKATFYVNIYMTHKVDVAGQAAQCVVEPWFKKKAPVKKMEAK